MLVTAFLSSPVGAVSSRSTDPPLEAGLLARNAVYANQAAAGAVAASPLSGALADEPWDLNDPLVAG
eukprot:4739345-Lingulodinium_polyedra.AAC.1